MMIKATLLAPIVALGFATAACAADPAPVKAASHADAAPAPPAWCHQKAYARRWQGGALSARQAARCPAPVPAPSLTTPR
jgi:hypothetical protein